MFLYSTNMTILSISGLIHAKTKWENLQNTLENIDLLQLSQKHVAKEIEVMISRNINTSFLQ